jgi:hypothetical protein
MGTKGEAKKLLERLETQKFEMNIELTPELIRRLDTLTDLYSRAHARNKHKRKSELADSEALINET